MPSTSRLRTWATSVASDVWYGGFPAHSGAYGDSVLWDEEGAHIARATLAGSDPCMIARFGSTELACVNFYTRWRMGRAVAFPYPRPVRRAVRVNSGIFPTDDEWLDRFSALYLDALSRVNVLGVWFNRNEDKIVGRFCPDARLVQLEALNCVLRRDPWSAELAGKKVLVVHPFASTIESQYRDNRARLFANPDTLPEFELTTLRAVQSLGGEGCGFESWFSALDHMKAQMAEMEFDVAVIGAGAYGLPLAASVKDSGRQAVHFGGATQLLFGIRGRRWEIESPHDIAPLFNEYWVRPSAEETPEVADQVEGGCYW